MRQRPLSQYTHVTPSSSHHHNQSQSHPRHPQQQSLLPLSLQRPQQPQQQQRHPQHPSRRSTTPLIAAAAASAAVHHERHSATTTTNTTTTRSSWEISGSEEVTEDHHQPLHLYQEQEQQQHTDYVLNDVEEQQHRFVREDRHEYRQRYSNTPHIAPMMNTLLLSDAHVRVGNAHQTINDMRRSSAMAASITDMDVNPDRIITRFHATTSSTTTTTTPRLYYQNGEVHFRKTGNKRRTRPEEFHTVYRTPHHVPDRKFKEYLHGRSNHRPAIQPPWVTEETVLRSCLGFSVIGLVFLTWVGILLDVQPLYIKGALSVHEDITKANGQMVSRYRFPIHSSSQISSSSSSSASALKRLPSATVAYHTALVYCLVALYCGYRLHYCNGLIRTPFCKKRSQYEDIPDMRRSGGNYNHQPMYDGDAVVVVVDTERDEDEDKFANVSLPVFFVSDRGSIRPGGSSSSMSSRPLGYHHDTSVTATTAYQVSTWSRMKASALQWLVLRGWTYRPVVNPFRRKRTPKCV